MSKNVKVSDDVYWRLRELANAARCSVPEMVEKLAGAGKIPVRAGEVPSTGWRAPAVETAPVLRPNPVQKAAPPRPPVKQAPTADEIRQSYLDKSARAPMSAKAAMTKLSDSDDVEF